MGASPSMSTISNAAVFWPSMRNGFTEFTTSTPGRVPELAHDRERVVEVAVDRHELRAVDERLRELAQRDVARPAAPRRTTSPARAAYAAADADVLPVDAQIASLAPRSTAIDIAIVIPRSLNDPVGLSPSTFNHTCATPARCATLRRVEQRCVALEQRDHGRRVGHREVLAVLLDHARATERSFLFSHDPQHRPDAMHRVDVLQRVAPSCRTSASRALCVTKMSRASSPMPRWFIDRIDTPWRPNSVAIAASTPGRSATSIRR